MRVGGGFLYDYVAYSQDEDSKSQMSLQPTGKLRDFRILLKGEFPKIPGLTYTLGYMYDAGAESWRFRMTGLQYEIPKLYGALFVGRTKEGSSTSKNMVGYQGWTMERSTSNDAFLPILADGVKWSGHTPDGQIVYTLGWFGDSLSEKESFNKSDGQVVGHVTWLPFINSNPGRLLHLGLAYRRGDSDEGFLQFKSKPESFPAQSNAIDTGKMEAQHSDLVTLETYYRPGPFMVGGEYYFNKVSSRTEDNPSFHGGNVFAAWTATGEIRPYNKAGAVFDRISPKRTVFEGGPGAWELVLNYSYSDLDSKAIKGGKFWRITPMVNWHLSDNMRLEFAYGYGVLHRFNTQGATQFFQTRLQLQL
ncbi:MAG: porin [Pseudomonadota bacterium]